MTNLQPAPELIERVRRAAGQSGDRLARQAVALVVQSLRLQLAGLTALELDLLTRDAQHAIADSNEDELVDMFDWGWDECDFAEGEPT
ncbi:MAG TPA: hypothetical protein VF913_06680 [Xanthobacteraceae bacterium]